MNRNRIALKRIDEEMNIYHIIHTFWLKSFPPAELEEGEEMREGFVTVPPPEVVCIFVRVFNSTTQLSSSRKELVSVIEFEIIIIRGKDKDKDKDKKVRGRL